MKYLLIVLLITLTKSFTAGSATENKLNFNFKMMKNLPRKPEGNLQQPNQTDSPVSKKFDLYSEGWISYSKLQTDLTDELAFYENPNFLLEQLPSKQNHLNNPLNVPDKYSFFFKVLADSLVISKSRKSFDLNIVESLPISKVFPVKEDDEFTGGVRQMGKVGKQNCLELKSGQIAIKSMKDFEENKNKASRVVICSPNQPTVSNLFQSLTKARLKYQRDNNLFLFDKNDESNDCEKSQETRNGYWKIFNKSECSEKCGPGFITVQRLCVPPVNGGKPCEGEATIQTKCELKKCDDGSKWKDSLPISKEVGAVQFFSDKNQFAKCRIYVSDIFFQKSESDEKKRPAKLIVNPSVVMLKTFDGTLTTNIKLLETIINESDVELVGGDLNYKLFPFPDNVESFFAFFRMHFHLFRDKCGSELKKSSPKKESKTENELSQKRLEYQNEMQMHEKQIKNKKKESVGFLGDFEQMQVSKLKMETKLMSIKEDLEREIRNKKLNKMKELKQKHADILKREEAIEKRRKMKEDESLFNEEQHILTDLENKAQAELNKELIIEKTKLKSTLSKLKEDSEVEIEEMKGKILNEQSKLKEMESAPKGDIVQCQSALGNKKLTSSYCRKSFSNLEAINLCLTMDANSFCETCCSTEFEFNPEEEKNCMVTLCNKTEKVSTLDFSYNILGKS